MAAHMARRCVVADHATSPARKIGQREPGVDAPAMS